MPSSVSDYDDIDSFLRAHEQKEMVRFVVVGSVDDGKSSLIGRLLYDTGSVFDDQLAHVRRASKMAGTEIDFSLFTDGLLSEREQGITIDVAYRYFATQKRKFIIADTPGHVQYTRNMATGASTADIAVILIDARLGVLPQSCRHATIASMFGIRHLVVAVNKMDLEGFEQSVFKRHCDALSAAVRDLRFESISFVPVSAVLGDNIVGPGAHMPWYSGPSLLTLLETLPIARDVSSAAFRFPVQTVLRPNHEYRGYAGRIESGSVRKGDAVTVYPSKKTTQVVAIDTFSGELDEAFAPLSVVLRVADEIDVGRGDVFGHAHSAPRESDTFDALLVWLGDQPLVAGKAYFMKLATSWERVRVESIDHVLNPETLETLPAAQMVSNDVGRVRVHSFRAVTFDPFATCRRMGAFVVVDTLTNETVGAGMIQGEPVRALAGQAVTSRSRVTEAERRERLGHGGAVVAIERSQAPDALAIAVAAERLLFERGVLATVVDWGERTHAEHVASAGLVALWVGPAKALSALEAPEATVADAARTLVARLEAVGVIGGTGVDL